MGNFTSMAKEISLGCRSGTHPIDEFKDIYDDNRRSVIPMATPVYEEEDVLLAVNECGEEVVIAVPKWWNLKG
jgi:hypothetical protein